jgi:hypothetical protein
VRTREEVLADPAIVDLRTATVGPGDAAPDFDLPLTAGGRVRLSELVARGPVALVFGSYT